MWFEQLTGFAEQPTSAVRERLRVEGVTLLSLANGRSYVCGTLETPSLAELRARVVALGGPLPHGRGSDRGPSDRAGSVSDRSSLPHGRGSVREVVADVQHLHTDGANAGALFQVASQFNLLEMTGPGVTPEAGVDIYEHDHTQGPACAVAAGAGTIYRNYFAPVGDQVGQSASRQIDCLADLGAALGNTGSRLWTMRNGYALLTAGGLDEIAARLRAAGEEERDRLRRLLRIGLHWQTQVTLRGCQHLVSQAYCSALPVAYNRDLGGADWEPLATLVLEAAYEATLCAAVLNVAGHAGQGPSRRLYLTLLGGGVFGNQREWIFAALRRAVGLYRDWGLDIAVVSYGRSDPAVVALAGQLDG